MVFQALDDKGRHFMDLLNDNLKPVESSTTNSSLWLKLFDHSSSLCTRATRAIVNHASIGEYRLRFFSQEEFKCSCGFYPIKTRYHIFHNYKRYNVY